MRPYPDEAVGPFEPPPRTVTDRDGRQIRLVALTASVDASTAQRELNADAHDDSGDGTEAYGDPGDAADAHDDPSSEEDTTASQTPDPLTEALVAMYEAFDPADRAQGIPPTGESRIRRWLDDLTTGETYNVVACHEDRAVGHATLVPASEGYELAIFVLSAYQGAGIGTELLHALLGLGAHNGVERVWLSVERWNDPAIGLYRKVGFETCNSASFELEMAAQLAAPGG